MGNREFVLDPNMLAEVIKKEDAVFHSVKEAPFQLYGLYDPLNQPTFCRMPQAVADQVSRGVANLNRYTAGGRVRFATDSTYIAIHVKTSTHTLWMNMTPIAACGFDLYIDDPKVGGRTPKSRFVQPFRPPHDFKEGYTAITELPGRRMRYFTLNFPMYNTVDELYIGIEKDATLAQGLPYVNEKPILYYGSSITQGASASRPGLAYTAIISRRLNCDYLNLGFSGNGKAEPVMVDYLKSLDPSIFVCDYDHNAPSVEYLRETHYPLYAAMRESHPDLPIVLISRPDFHSHTQSGQIKTDDSLARRDVIIDTFRRARADGDTRVWFIDGEGFFNGPDEEDCTVDGTHPNDLGMMKMADTVHRVLLRVLNDVPAFSENQ